MNEGAIVSLVAMFGWLILVFGAYRSHRVDASKTVRMALIWLSIFVGLAILFGLIL